ncbi:MAG: hypothetical protein ACREJ0_30385 [Geminicoccaceae bacterium]
MKTMVAVRAMAASAILAVGGATVASAQTTTSFFGLSCAVAFNQFPDANIPPDLRGEVWVTTETEKTCPGQTPASQTVILECFGVVEDWASDFTLATNAFTCRISGEQCGFSGSGVATSQRITIDPNGNVDLRCSANQGAFN